MLIKSLYVTKADVYAENVDWDNEFRTNLCYFQSLTSVEGTGVGLDCMWGKRAWNSVTSRRESISAAVFKTPGTKWILCWRERSIRRLIRVIKCGSFEVFILITCTTAILSECRITVQFLNQWHHSSNAMTIGRNSRTAMWNWSQLLENCPKNHYLPKVQPYPRSLASVNKCREAEEWVMPDGKSAFPLKWSKNNPQAFVSLGLWI